MVVALLCSCATRKSREITFEIKAPADRALNPNTRIVLIFGNDAQGTPLRDHTKEYEQGDAIYHYSWLIHPKGRKARYALIVEPHGEPNEVFYLPISSKTQLPDWTSWQNPDAFETTNDAAWKVMHQQIRSPLPTAYPTNHLQLRYKIGK